MNINNISELVQLGCPAEWAAAFCETLSLCSPSEEEFQDTFHNLKENIDALRN